jgi:hypothetical protein
MGGFVRMSQIGKGRGYRWETEVAKIMGGKRMNSGPGVDVEARGRYIECKSQQDYAGMGKLLGWIQQAQSYGPNWALAVRLGLRNKKITFMVISVEEYEKLTKDERDGED